MSAEYITVTPATEEGEDKAMRRIFCHAIIAFYTTEKGEHVIVLMDGQPTTIWESPEQLEAQLSVYQPE